MTGWDCLRLIYNLRQIPVPVSTADVRDSLLCLIRYPELPPKSVLRSILIHRPEDFPVFELVWHVLFDSSGLTQESDSSLLEERRGSPGPGGQGWGRGSGGYSYNPKIEKLSPFPLLQDFNLTLNSRLAEMSFEEAVTNLLAEAGYFGWINTVDLAYQRGKILEEEFTQLKAEALNVQNRLRRDLVTWQILRENNWAPLRRQYWHYKPLKTLTEEEKALVQKAICQWAKKLAVRPGRQKRKSRSGEPNLPAVVRNFVQGDGHIFRLEFRRNIPRIPELVVLCDISNSVAPYVEFFLFLLGKIKQKIRKVRLFLFIDTLWDVSDNTWEDMADIKEQIQSWSRKASSGFSDYGKVFKEFAGYILPEVSARSTLVILGDGKNNYRLPQPEYLQEIKDKVKRVYWLNPLEEQEWFDRENALPYYQPFCSLILRCRTAEDLKEITRKIF